MDNKEERPVEQNNQNNTQNAEVESGDVKTVALAYAKYLKDKGLKPGDATFAEDQDLGLETEEAVEDKPADVKGETKPADAADVKEEAKPDPKSFFTEEEKAMATEKAKEKAKEMAKARIHRRKKPEIKAFEKEEKGVAFLSKAIDIGDNVRDRVDGNVVGTWQNFAKGTHDIISTYRNTRRAIVIGLLTMGAMIATILIVFNEFTAYEYAYNGKVLGYVSEQEEVTEVLGVAGDKLTENNGNGAPVEFIPNRNVTFSLVDSQGKSMDDADTAVNKLIYMTDIETEAFGVYDGPYLIAVVKSNEDAELLLEQTKNELSRPDDGMTLVSSEFTNPLDIRPINILLTSVQDNTQARNQMINGGSMEIYHILEEGETLESIGEAFGVETSYIYDETNTQLASEPEQGDKVCVHCNVNPVGVTMIETGRMREIIEYETVKKETDQYYKGDTYVEQEGSDGIQIFDGTIIKQNGEVVDRQEASIEVIREPQDKIILVGTAERPKTAPTGVFAMPLKNSYVLSSPYGPRWGRMHTGLDMACPTGTPIYASDGGTVITSSYLGGYGNCIVVDHGNGKATRYAHCSRLDVNVGDKVYQGQEIALVGSTGNSTGSHLHFEIIINGSTTNPAPYLGM